MVQRILWSFCCRIFCSMKTWTSMGEHLKCLHLKSCHFSVWFISKIQSLPSCTISVVMTYANSNTVYRKSFSFPRYSFACKQEILFWLLYLNLWSSKLSFTTVVFKKTQTNLNCRIGTYFYWFKRFRQWNRKKKNLERLRYNSKWVTTLEVR